MAIITVPTLESLAGEITRLQGELSEMAKDLSVTEIVNRFPHVEVSRWKQLTHNSIEIRFSIERTVLDWRNFEQQLSGKMLFAYDVQTNHDTVGGSIGPSFEEWEESSDLTWKELYTAGVLFDPELVTPLHMNGHGWKLSTAQSQYGALLGDLKTNGMGDYSWVRFFSQQHLQKIPEQLEAVYVHQDRSSHSYMGSRIKLPATLPLPFALLNANGGTECVRYNGFAFRPKDVTWGNGEFMQLVGHLGLGSGIAPEYAFNEMSCPYPSPELPLE